MIDHLVGRPSVTFRKYQVLAVVCFWSAYLLKGNRHGPPVVNRFSSTLSQRLTVWQTVIITLLWLYVARNFGKLVGLECPEPLANLYTRAYFRATWVTTALDAGFWSAMRIKRKWARDFWSIIFSIYYLICAEQADEKVRKIRSVATVEHLRISWNKNANSPYLAGLTRLLRPRFMRHAPREIRIRRPSSSSYTEPVHGWLYFDGPLSALKRHTKVILHIPGGGFVAMSPRTHEDALTAWAGKTGIPVLSLDYRKAPEFPYPYALNECFDVYTSIVSTNGRCIGLGGSSIPSIVVAGDSAGGNLAAGLTLMILQSGSTDTRRWLGERAHLPAPDGLVLIYPALDMNIGNWMTDEQMSLIRDRRARGTNKRVLRHKSGEFQRMAPGTPFPSEENDSDEHVSPPPAKVPSANTLQRPISLSTPVRTRLATPSLLTYVSDRILTPEIMRAMIILYIGPHNRPDFSTDYLLSPVLAPDSLLTLFPKTYFLTGERDPLVDDTLIMAGRLRAAKAASWQERRELGLLSREERRRGFVDREHVEVVLIDGISHGFLQFASVFPEAWGLIARVGRWFEEAFALGARKTMLERAKMADVSAKTAGQRHHHRSLTQSSAEEDKPLEMTRVTRDAPLVNDHTKHNGPPRIDIPRNESMGDGDSRPVTPYTPYTPAEGLAREHPFAKSRTSGNRKSLVSLASDDDLLGRRMKGIVGGLTRVDTEG